MSVRLIDNLDKILPAVREKVAERLNIAASEFVDEAARAAPVDSGFMKSAIGQTKAATASDLVAEVRSLAPYSGFVNFGTVKMAAQPFWTNTWLIIRSKFKGIILGEGGSAGRGVISAALSEFKGR